MGTGLTVFPQDALGYTIQAIYPHKSAVVTSAVANAQYQIGSQCKAVRLENKDATNEIVLTFGCRDRRQIRGRYRALPAPSLTRRHRDLRGQTGQQDRVHSLGRRWHRSGA